jgi:PAS domain S-box-containing protein
MSSSNSSEPDLKRGWNSNQALITTFLGQVPDIVYFKDRESRFVAVSESLIKKHGLKSSEHVIGKTDFDFFEEKSARKAFDDEQKIMLTGEPIFDVPTEETWADGRTSWSLNSKMPLRDESGAIIGTFGIGRDITQARETELALARTHQQLIEASRVAGMAEVATSVLHNVGNVLNSANVSTSLISRGLKELKIDNLDRLCALLREHSVDLGAFLTEDPKGKKVLEFLETLASHLQEERTRLVRETESLRDSVQRIKEVVSLQLSHAAVADVVEAFPARPLMEDALRLNFASIEREKISVVYDYRDVPPVCAERGKVLQILAHLINNASYSCSQRSESDRTMTIRIGPAASGRVHFVVEDNGIGIAPENMVRIFSQGFTTRPDGHGFGLHAGALDAKKMGGSLQARSAGPGQGASFVLELPTASKAAGG